MTQPDPRAQIRNAEAAWAASTLQPALDKVPKAQQEMTTLSEIPIVPVW
jgi:hypothetical protein